MPSTLPKFAAVYAFLYAAFGVQSPFLPALLGEQGLHAEEIGIVLGASTAIRVLAGPTIGHAADRLHRHTLILCGCAIVAAVAGLGYLMMRGLGSLLAVGLLQAAMLAPIVPLSDALATTAAHESESSRGRRFDYGWLRAAGSAAFIVGTMLSGWAAGKTGLPSIIWFSGALLVIGGIAALVLPKLPVGDVAHNGARPPIVRDWVLLLRLAVYRRVLIIAALVEGSHALHDAFSVIRWQTAGMDLSIIGLLWSESVLSEVVVFLLVGPRLVRLLGPGGACALAAGAGAIRWTVVAFTTSPVLLGLVQPLHGLTFALLHLACMRLIVQVVPVHWQRPHNRSTARCA
jgi:MFS transporter, PPP family, 3-phenylpropionic acid transporter